MTLNDEHTKIKRPFFSKPYSVKFQLDAATRFLKAYVIVSSRYLINSYWKQVLQHL